MEPMTLWIIGGVGLLFGICILFLFLKGLLKLVFIFGSTIAGVVSYFWLMKHGGVYLSFVWASPERWMVSALAVVGSLVIFLVIMQGAFWISGLFSWGKTKGAGGVKGILVSMMMFGVILWLVCIGVLHYGSISDIERYVNIATDLKAREAKPILMQAKKFVEGSSVLKMVDHVDPFNDPERVKLAKVLAYMAAEKDTVKLGVCHATLTKTLPYFNRLKKISLDPAVQTYISKKDMGALLGDPKLTKLLSEETMRGSLKTFDPDVLFGMKK